MPLMGPRTSSGRQPGRHCCGCLGGGDTSVVRASSLVLQSPRPQKKLGWLMPVRHWHREVSEATRSSGRRQRRLFRSVSEQLRGGGFHSTGPQAWPPAPPRVPEDSALPTRSSLQMRSLCSQGSQPSREEKQPST